MPRIFVVLENATNDIVYTSTQYTKAKSFINSMPDSVRDCFSLVRYDANENWTTNKEYTK